MARRLINQNRQAEWAEQDRLQTRLVAASSVRLQREIGRTMRVMLQDFERTGNVHANDEHQRRVRQILTAGYSEAIQASADRLLDGAKGFHGRMWHKDRRSVYERILLEFLAKRGGAQIADDISETTKRQIMTMVAMGRRDGLGQDAIARMISGRIATVSRARSAVIARTETHSAAGFANHEAAVDTGLPLDKEWISAADERTREDHSAADGQTVHIHEPFSVGGESLAFPGDPSGSAEMIINCRCVESFVVRE